MAYERVNPKSGLKWLRFQVGIFSYLLFVWLEMRSFKGTLRSNQNSHLQKWRIYPKQCILSHGGWCIWSNRNRVGVKLTVYHIDCSGGWRIWSHSSAVQGTVHPSRDMLRIFLPSPRISDVSRAPPWSPTRSHRRGSSDASPTPETEAPVSGSIPSMPNGALRGPYCGDWCWKICC